MLPFIFGIIWQLNKLISYYFNKEYVGLVLFLIIVDPTLLSQITLVSPDVPLTFFFLLSWNSIINDRKNLLLISTFFLFLTSMRGMMVAFCLLLIDIFYNINFKASLNILINSLLKRSIIYLPSLILFLSFSIYHFLVKDWIGFHDESPWVESFKGVGFNGFIFNLGILGWRIIDFGRIGIWIVFSILITKYRNKIFNEKKIISLSFFYIIFLLILPLNMLWAKNLLAHRYLLPIYIIFSILVAKILFSSYIQLKLRRMLIIVWLFFIATGNFWIYPDKISQGWDSSLAYLPYFELRKMAIQYLNKEKIGINKVYSFFPNTSTFDEVDLNEDYRKFKRYEKGANYVLYSNVNNISDKIYDDLISEYSLLKEFKSSTVFIRLYELKTK